MKLCPQCKSEYPGGEVFCPHDGARLESPSQMVHSVTMSDDPLVGTTLADRYRIIRRIGEGGMGLVYEAQHVIIGKRVAVKLLRDDFSSRPDVVERFELEAKSASRIGDEHIVDISDFGRTPAGVSYFVMEYLDGEDLASLLAREGTLPPERAVHILAQCCRGLSAAHAKGIVHRDMKPENAFLTHRSDVHDFVKLVDFGIAKMSDIETDGAPGRKLTKTGMIFGTPEYMSPEQASGRELDHRVDVYAVGVMLFECLVGRVPFVGDTFMGILTQHLFEDPPALASVNPAVAVHPALEEVVYKALAKDPAHRYQTMDELHDAMVGALDNDAAAVAATSKARRPPSAKFAFGRTDTPAPTAPSRGSSVLLGAALATLLVGAGVGIWALLRSEPVAMNVEPDAPAAAPIVPTAAPVAPEDTAVAPAAQVDAEAPDAGLVAPPLVRLTVTTRPTGATVRIEDGDATCEPTPCAIEVPRGAPLVLRAERGRTVGELELTPEEAMTVQIALTRRPSGRPTTTEATPRPSTDLKVPEIFQ